MRILLLLEIISGLGGVCGIGYYLICIWSARDFRRWSSAQKTRTSRLAPPVSILKPLHGADPGMYEALRSHCLQEYPEYELIFGVSEEDDPVIPLVQRLQSDFPERPIRLLVCSEHLGPNVKVSNLAQMLPQAKHEFILVNDGDIRVPEDYLGRVMGSFADPKVGLVTCLYRAIAGKSLGSRLEAIGISTEFMAGVLTARRIEDGVHFALGSTLAMRKDALEAIGGFESLLEYLADDYELGLRISQAGSEVVLSDVVVETHLPEYTLRGFLNHQLRWGRSTRDSRRWGYLGLLFTFGLPWSLLAVIFARGAIWAWILLATALIVRCAMALVVGTGVVEDKQVWPNLWLVPIREFVAALVWIGSYTGSHVTWRGREFVVRSKKLYPVEDIVPSLKGTKT
jgi:ceramide glucosyltransferase